MPESRTKLKTAVEAYLADLRRVRASGGATGERFYYPPIANLLNAIGGTLRPKVFCVGELAQQGAGQPDFGLYAGKQVQRGKPRGGQLSEGSVEVKPSGDEAWLTVDSRQVSRYWHRYRLVLVTNTRDWVLLGEDAMIAATALAHRLMVATRNVRGFGQLGVELLNPFQSETG